MVTVETAVALCTLVVALGLVLAAVATMIDQLRCMDAAREAARLAARGEPDRGHAAAARIAPTGAQVTIRADGDAIAVEVTSAAVLPGLELAGRAYAVAEPGASAGGGDG